MFQRSWCKGSILSAADTSICWEAGLPAVAFQMVGLLSNDGTVAARQDAFLSSSAGGVVGQGLIVWRLLALLVFCVCVIYRLSVCAKPLSLSVMKLGLELENFILQGL